jgi:hypothetical protein
MEPEKGLESDDIEIAEMYATLIWNTKGLDYLKEILNKSDKYGLKNYFTDKIFLYKITIFESNYGTHLKDPTKSIIIDLK